MILIISDFFHPVHGFPVERLLDGDVGHGGGRTSTMPMLFAGWEPDDVARANLFDGTAPALGPTAARGDDQGLAQRVGVPGSNETVAPVTRAGSVPLKGESRRTVPVNQSAGPLAEGCEPAL